MRRICPFALVHPPNHGPMCPRFTNPLPAPWGCPLALPQLQENPPTRFTSCSPSAPSASRTSARARMRGTFCSMAGSRGGVQLPPPSLPASQRAFVKFPGSRESCSTQNCQQALPGRAYKPKLHLSSGKGGREATP